MTKLAQSMPGRHAKCCAYTAMLSGLLVSQLALGAAQSALMACRELRDDQQRLNCYDALARQSDTREMPATLAMSENDEDAPRRQTETVPDISPLAAHWETDPESKNGLWTFRAHKPNYFLLGRYTDKVNYQPYDAYLRSVGDPNVGLDHTESKFQLSFKLKTLENLFGRGIDVCLATPSKATGRSTTNVFQPPSARPITSRKYLSRFPPITNSSA